MMSLTVAEFGILVAASTTLLTVVIRLGRAHINRRVEVSVDGRVDVAVGQAMAVISSKLDTISLNQRENSAALGRVHDLEVTIKNGLQAEVERIGTQVDQLVAHQLGWDGNDRRTR